MKKIKFKPKKAAVKRLKPSKNNKLKKKCAYTSHLALDKTTKQKRHLRKGWLVSPSDFKRVKDLLVKR